MQQDRSSRYQTPTPASPSRASLVRQPRRGPVLASARMAVDFGVPAHRAKCLASYSASAAAALYRANAAVATGNRREALARKAGSGRSISQDSLRSASELGSARTLF